MVTLYDLKEELLAIQEELEENGVDAQTISDTIEGMALEFDEKCKAVACFIRNLEASADAIKEAERSMAERRKRAESRAAGMRDYLIANMQAVGRNKIEFDLFGLSLRKCPASVEIEDDSLVPVDLLAIKPPPPPAPDKNRIKEMLKAGLEVAGCRLVENKMRLEIK